MQWIFYNFVYLKREKSLLEDILQLIVVLFAAESVVFVVVCLSFFWCYCLKAPLCITIVMTVKHVFKRNITCLTQLFNCFSLFFFIMYPPICFEPEGICFGAPASQIPTFVDNGEDVFCNYLHAMGGVRKEGWIGDIFMKLSFWWLKNLTSGTFGWMLEHSSHRAVIVADNDINDKESI